MCLEFRWLASGAIMASFMFLPLALLGPFGILVALLASYLIGALPFGFLMAKAKGVDLRLVGSGNIGATNTMRALDKPLGLFAFFLDCAKGYVAAAWLWRLAEGSGLWLPVACGALAVVGHCFPVYLGFRGGKGVATACGALLAIDPVVFLVGGLVWVGLAYFMRYVSLASMGMSVAFPVAALVRWGLPGWPLVLGLAALMGLILHRHRSNWERIKAGTEPKMGASKHESGGAAKE